MYYLYILHSDIAGKYYVGSSESPGDRLRKHNAKHKGFTGPADDWKIVYTEVYSTKQQALQREKQIKSWKSKKMTEALIKGSAG